MIEILLKGYTIESYPSFHPFFNFKVPGYRFVFYSLDQFGLVWSPVGLGTFSTDRYEINNSFTISNILTVSLLLTGTQLILPYSTVCLIHHVISCRSGLLL